MLKRRNAIYVLTSIALLVGLFTGRSLFFNVAILFGGLMILSYLWTWLSIRGLGIGRTTRTRRAQVGQVFQEAFSVNNRGFLPKLWLEIRDHSTLPNHNASHVVPIIRGFRKHTWVVETVCAIRGEFRLGPIEIISGDPFGLFLTPREITQTERVIVYPPTVPIEQMRLPSALLSGGEAQRQISHNITTHAAGVRDYVPGDSLNRMHWKSSARRGKLIVKEFEIDPVVNIWLLPDFSASSLVEEPDFHAARQSRRYVARADGNAIPPSTEEYTVAITASIAKHFVEKERSVAFTGYIPQREVYEPERGMQHLNRILEALAVARSVSEFPFAGVLGLEQTYFRRGTTLVIITSSLDARWVEEAQIMLHRGLRVLCVLIDPQSFGGLYPSGEIQNMLQLAKLPHILVHQHDDLSDILAQYPVI